MIVENAKNLRSHQHADGGWSQLDSLSSDAYATGQSLYALHTAAALPVMNDVYKRGVNFLLNTQFDDGSWLVISRSHPVIPFVESGFPHEKNQFISAAGSSWATIALLISTKETPPYWRKVALFLSQLKNIHRRKRPSSVRRINQTPSYCIFYPLS